MKNLPCFYNEPIIEILGIVGAHKLGPSSSTLPAGRSVDRRRSFRRMMMGMDGECLMAVEMEVQCR